MNIISIIILVIVVLLAIGVLTYVAHDRGSSMCVGCHGDCANCDSKIEQEEKKEDGK